MNLEFFVLAPEIPDLIEIDDELGFIADHFAIHPQPPLAGIVNAADIEYEAERNQADVLFIASHNDNDGIVVSDGRINEDNIVGYARALGATLVILSVCDGERIAKRIHRATGVAVLFCRIVVADRDAMLYTARFVSALARCDSYHDAFVDAGNARGRYGLLEGREMNTGGTTGAISALSEQLSALSREVSGLRVEMASLKAQMDFMRERAQIPPSLPISSAWLYAFGFLLMLMTTGIFIGLFK